MEGTGGSVGKEDRWMNCGFGFICTPALRLNVANAVARVRMLVLMSVVKIGPVGMSVDQRVVDVPMAMPAHTDSWGIFIVMMLIVEPVPVIMLDLGVQVLMLMLFQNQGAQRCSNEDHSQSLKK